MCESDENSYVRDGEMQLRAETYSNNSDLNGCQTWRYLSIEIWICEFKKPWIYELVPYHNSDLSRKTISRKMFNPVG